MVQLVKYHIIKWSFLKILLSLLSYYLPQSSSLIFSTKYLQIIDQRLKITFIIVEMNSNADFASGYVYSDSVCAKIVLRQIIRFCGPQINNAAAVAQGY